MGIETIKWDDILTNINKEYRTSYESIRDMLKKMYSKISPNQMGNLIGVSNTTIYKKLDYYGIRRRHIPGGNNYIGYKKPLFLKIPDEVLVNMTNEEISEEIGCTPEYVRKLIKGKNNNNGGE